MSEDKVTVSISREAQAILTVLVEERHLFVTELAAYLAAAALAVSRDLDPVASLGPSAGTKWNKGSGAIGEWSALASWYLPTDEPIKSLERYAESGLRFLRERLNSNDGLGDLFGLA